MKQQTTTFINDNRVNDAHTTQLDASRKISNSTGNAEYTSCLPIEGEDEENEEENEDWKWIIK